MNEVTVSKGFRSFGSDLFKRVRVGDESLKLVRVLEGVWLVELWDTNERVPQHERSGKPGVWSSERAAVARGVEHVYEHSAIASEAHRVAARWLVARPR